MRLELCFKDLLPEYQHLGVYKIDEITFNMFTEADQKAILTVGQATYRDYEGRNESDAYYVGVKEAFKIILSPPSKREIPEEKMADSSPLGRENFAHNGDQSDEYQ